MTTTATQLNTRKLLSQLANSKSSGCLWFEAELVSWKIYLQQGSLKYAYCSAQLLDQLKYYLYYLGFKQAVAALKNLPSHDPKLYSHWSGNSLNLNLYSEIICWLLEKKYIETFQHLKLIEHITKDALSSCLWSETGTISWHKDHFLPLWIIDDIPSLNLSSCLESEKARLKQWHKCSARLVSIHQRPYFAADWSEKPLPNSGVLKPKNLQELTQVIKGTISIRQLSLFLRKDELNVAKILSPYIDDGIIKLRKAQSPLDNLPSIPKPQVDDQQQLLFSASYSSNYEKINYPENPQNTNKIWQIVCIDDSPTILQEIQRFLATDKFEITAVTDPVQAVPIIFRVKPNLILLDITMPKINGYKLCGLLRGSEYCSDTPIIMVTGNTGLIDKARAKIAGATDYLTKPFTKEGLANIVTKHLR